MEAALAAGATEAEAWCERSTSRRIRVYAGEVESLSDAGSSGLGLRAFIDGRSGYAYGTDLSEAGVRSVGEAARAAAAVADPDEFAGLAQEPGVTEVPGLQSPAMAGWSNEDRVALALATERAARSRAGITQVENAVYSDSEGSAAIASSRGLVASYSATSAWAYVSAFAGEGEDLMTGMGIGLGRDPGALEPEAIGHEAADRALALWVPAGPRAGAARWSSTRSWRPRSPASSARCCRPTPSSAAARSSPSARATRWPARRSCSPTTAAIPRARPRRRSTARARPRGARR